MDELASQWYQAGSLFLEAAFLIAAVWSVRAILKSIRASQEQMGALLQLTVGGAHSEAHARSDQPTTPYPLVGCPEAPQRSSAEATMEGTQNQRNRRSLWGGLVGWLKEPMASSNVGVWRRMVRWLEAPAGS